MEQQNLQITKELQDTEKYILDNWNLVEDSDKEMLRFLGVKNG